MELAPPAWQEDLRRKIRPEALPVGERREEISDLIKLSLEEQKVCLIQGETGSGKSILLPGMVYEQLERSPLPSRVLVVQPRRDAALNVSRAVSAVQKKSWGRNGAVGCATSETKEANSSSEITVVTTGIAIRYLSEMIKDIEQGKRPRFGGIMVDEFHENSVEYHMILGMLKILHDRGEAPLTLLTSATLEKEKIQHYFSIEDRHYMKVEGRRYEVENSLFDPRNTEYTENYYIQAAASEVKDILRSTTEGDILVFMPGLREINSVIHLLGHRGDGDVLPLHGSLSLEDRDAVLSGGRRRRVIVSTNIAETSLTLPGITAVVDSCRERSVKYNPATGIYERVTQLISKDSAEQRSGRAGRVRSGMCRRVVFPEEWEKMPKHRTSEIHRANLANVVLQLRGLGIDQNTFPFLDAPAPESLRFAEEQLKLLGAIDERGVVTPEGERMLDMPFFEPPLARSIVEAEKQNCVDQALVLAILERESSLFYTPSQREILERQKSSLEEKGYEVRGPLDIRSQGQQLDPEVASKLFQEQHSVALGNLREQYREKHAVFGHGSDWIRNLSVFSHAIENGLFDALRSNRTPEGKRAERELSKWCEEYRINKKALLHAAQHVSDYSRALGIDFDMNTLERKIAEFNHSDMEKVILAGYPHMILVNVTDSGRISRYRFLQGSAEEIFISSASAAFGKSSTLCVATRVNEGKGSPGKGKVTRNYASGVHPISLQRLCEVSPHLVTQKGTETFFDWERGTVFSSVQVASLHNSSRSLGEYKREATAEEAQEFFAQEFLRGYGRLFSDMPIFQENREIIQRLEKQQIRFGKNVLLPDLQSWYKDRLKNAPQPVSLDSVRAHKEDFALKEEDYFSVEKAAELAPLYPEHIELPQLGQVAVVYTYDHTSETAHVAHVTLELPNEPLSLSALSHHSFSRLTNASFPRLGTENDPVHFSLVARTPEGLLARSQSVEELQRLVRERIIHKAWSAFERSNVSENEGEVNVDQPFPLDQYEPKEYIQNEQLNPLFAYPVLTPLLVKEDLSKNRYIWRLTWERDRIEADRLNEESSHFLKKEKIALDEWRSDQKRNIEEREELVKRLRSRIQQTHLSVFAYSRGFDSNDLVLLRQDLEKYDRLKEGHIHSVDLNWNLFDDRLLRFEKTLDGIESRDRERQHELEKYANVMQAARGEIDDFFDRVRALSEDDLNTMSLGQWEVDMLSQEFSIIQRILEEDPEKFERLKELVPNTLQKMRTYATILDVSGFHRESETALSHAFRKSGISKEETPENIQPLRSPMLVQERYRASEQSKQQEKVAEQILPPALLERINAESDLEVRGIIIMEEKELLHAKLKAMEEEHLGLEALLAQSNKLTEEHNLLKKMEQSLNREIGELTERKADKQREGTLRLKRRDIAEQIKTIEAKLKGTRARKNNLLDFDRKKDEIKKQIDELDRLEDETLSLL
ncbi:MAG: DEAD/DEAH box helicase [Candidatus Moraniibacteriota bacterium]|nr:MAG: DEAD/DEAH box helicase [Candidatus Moranbacteria bacterium]